MLEIINGYKHYRGKAVLKNINLAFEKGKIYGIVGENGSGKTLILKALAGHIKLTQGAVKQNKALIRNKHNLLKNAGIVIEQPNFLSHLTLRGNLDLLIQACYLKADIDLNQWLKYFDIEEHQEKRYKTLSLGTKQKMLIIQGFMGDPEILLLDEVSRGLDDQSVRQLNQLILQKKAERLTILTSHLKTEIQGLCDEVIVVSDGEVVSQSQKSV